MNKRIVVDIDKIKEYQKDLEKYNGVLPLKLMIYLDNAEYISNLRKKKNWGKIRRELFKRRRQIQFLSDESLLEFEDKELQIWLKKNKKYKDMILES
jgi:hypothetical protein